METDCPSSNLSCTAKGLITYGESLKQYRNTIRKKKEQHVRNQLNAIEESIDSNHFWENWKTLNQQHEELSTQNGDVWVNHFSNLFGCYNKEQKHLQDQIQILESTIKDHQNPLDSRTHWIPEHTGFQNTLDSPITLNELQDKIKTLQPKKACGVDGILNEMIKYTDHKFQLPILNPLTSSSPLASSSILGTKDTPIWQVA